MSIDFGPLGSYCRLCNMIHSMLGYIGVCMLSMRQKGDLVVVTRASNRSDAIKYL